MEQWMVKLLMEILSKLDIEKMLKDLLQQAKQEAFCWLLAKAHESKTPLDDVAVGILAGVLAVDPTKCPVMKVPV